jgi:hypothetical protein
MTGPKKNLSGKSEYVWEADQFAVGVMVYSTYDVKLREVGIIVEAGVTEAGDIRMVMWPDGAITTEPPNRLIKAE